MSEEAYHKAFENILKPIWDSIQADNKWKATITENIITIIGFVIAIIASIWLYNINQSVSQSLTELAPNKEVFEQNIDKVNILFGVSGMQMTEAYGLLGVALAVMASGIAWSSYRSGNRNTKIIIWTVGAATEGIITTILSDVSQLKEESNIKSRRLDGKTKSKNS